MESDEEFKAKMAAIKAKPYNLEDPAEIERLYRECGGYLQLCHHKHGTDWEGRKFAMEALEALAKKARFIAAGYKDDVASNFNRPIPPGLPVA